MSAEIYRFLCDLRADGVPIATIGRWAGAVSQDLDALVAGLENDDLLLIKRQHEDWVLQRERTWRVMEYHFVFRDGCYRIPFGVDFCGGNLWDGERADALWWIQRQSGISLSKELDWHSAVTKFCDEVWSAIAKESAAKLFGG